jgi:hypothetical protein
VVRESQVALAIVLLVSLGAATAAAQGFYYKEVRKDDRIYVFNNAEEAARFEASGEMGRSITRLGAGPNGETVVADSERALQLFFFKHGISEPVPEPAPPTMRVEWRDGKTRVTTDNAYLEISNRVQVRYTHEFPDDAVQLPGTSEAGDSKGSFRIRRAKFKLEGWIWKPELTYETQMNWPAVTGPNPGAFLEDAVIDWDVSRTSVFRVRAGQFKAPFGRQELTSSGNQSFVDRSLVSNEFARGRDTGVALWGVLGDNQFEYRFGVFNGNGLTRTTNDNPALQVNARLMWQPNKSQSLKQRAWVSGPLYSEGDFESTTTPIYALAVNYQRDSFRNTNTNNNLESDVVGVDGVFKFKGFFGTGEYFWRTRQPVTGPDFRSDGWYAQASQMLDRRRTWEAAFRYGWREISDLVDADGIQEIRGGINYYYRRHNLKLQADFGRVEIEQGPGRADVGTLELRIQTQFIF